MLWPVADQQRYARTRTPLDFRAVADAAAREALSLVSEWLPGGRLSGREYLAFNPRRADSRLGSFSICVGGSRCGAWADFADPSVRGRDLVSLYAYLNDLSQGAAAVALVRILRLT